MLWRDPREGGAAWRHLTQLPAKSFNQCVAVMDGFLYVAGGEDQNDARNQAKHAVSTLSRYEDRKDLTVINEDRGEIMAPLSNINPLLYKASLSPFEPLIASRHLN